MPKFIFKTMDGCEAAAYASYAFTEVAIVYPITPSTSMADNIHKFSLGGKKNIFGQAASVVSMQSEAGVAGAMHGSLSAGALSATYTSSQGLLLMIPNMYKMAGEFLPAVIHVAARTIAAHALSIFGDHSDVYACRQTGFCMLCSNTPQEAMDLAAISHLCSISLSLPFLHFFDGFRTSHEIQKVRLLNYEDLKTLLDKEALLKFKERSLTPESPVLRGSAQNDDIFFQAREASNTCYGAAPKIVKSYMNKFNKIYKTNYAPFNFYGHKEAEKIIIAMGSVCETLEEVTDYLNANGKKVGVIKVRMLRPFSAKFLLDTLPKTVKVISVLDRTKEPGSQGEPLYLDILSSLENKEIKILRGRYGLASKNVTPSDILAVFENMNATAPKKEFTIGIKDDVTNLSLEPSCKININTSTSCKFWGLGSDGTVGANKNSIKIIGNNTDLNVQGYFAYDSKKSGGLTVSHLRFSKEKIRSTYYVNDADFVACHNFSYVFKYDMLKDLKPKGKFLLNCEYNQKKLEQKLPNSFKKQLCLKEIQFYIINASKISYELGLEDKISTVLQSAFFKILNLLEEKKAKEYLKSAASRSFIKKGEDVVLKNHKAIEKGVLELIKVEVSKSWKDLPYDEKKDDVLPEDKNLRHYVENIMMKVNSYKGGDIPVSKFLPYKDGSIPQGSSAFEKRSSASFAPRWISQNCIQCNFCSFVCPHAVIRPAMFSSEELKEAGNLLAKDAIGFKNKYFAITISAKDCTGCANCVKICPGTKGDKALEMVPRISAEKFQKFFDFSLKLKEKPEIFEKFKRETVKGSQFAKPLLEFSGACAGCGQTPYAKLVTQLFGENMIIANATGCSSIWAGSSPSTPYTTNQKKRGPAWHNSLFEDNAEFGFGIAISKNAIRNKLKTCVELILNKTQNTNLKMLCSSYINSLNNTRLNNQASESLITFLEKNNLFELEDPKKEILENKNFLSKKSIWLFGGDGWAYDIGFGGLDHVVSSKEDLNVLIFDTEVYSNTGGQSSKATPMGACVPFALNGKETRKKPLALMLMSYSHVYVASVAMGANFSQCVKALKEAESYNGPSVVIAYSPCIAHGIKKGMNMTQLEQKYAVESGYWNLFRFDPRLKDESKNPFILDSKTTPKNYEEFLKEEARFESLFKLFPERAKKIFSKAELISKEKFDFLKNMSD